VKPQATKIKNEQQEDIPELLGSLLTLLLFCAMLGAVYASPFVIGWLIK
jgi:hypothetical protein